MEFFTDVPMAPRDPILGLELAYKSDSRPNKVNLGIGAYRTEQLEPYVLLSVKAAEKEILNGERNKEYLPIDGDSAFVRATQELVFGKAEGRVYGAQTVGGTGALRVVGAFLASIGLKNIYVSNPSWENHQRIFTHAGLTVGNYPYYDRTKHQLEMREMLDTLQDLPKGSIIVLHGCCHNPTGIDPSLEVWKEIAKICKEKELFPLIDFAYQGFGTGIEEDAAPIRHFYNEGLRFAVTVSYAKNFGLYGERVGALFFVCKEEDEAARVGSQVKVIIRGIYSNPPIHGSRIVATVLQNEALRKQWAEELASMRGRIQKMRIALTSLLPPQFGHIAKSNGMFAFTGLSEPQVEKITKDFGIYMLKSGRISLSGLNHNNVHYVAECVEQISKNI